MNEEKIPFWRDDRILRIAMQGLVVVILLIIITILGSNLVSNYRAKGLTFGFEFLTRSANFDIGETLINYQSSDSILKALLVGLLNTLRVITIGIVLATILGITVGIARLSDNWLVRQLATIYVEVLRNTPLLLQLLFWYLAVFLNLPTLDNSLVFFDHVFLSNRGLNIPWFIINNQSIFAFLWLVLSIVFLIIIWRRRTKIMVEYGHSGRLEQVILIALAIAFIITIIFGIDWQIPYLNNKGQVEGGLKLSPEFSALLIGLSIYTAAYIAEVVRAGIQSVNKGQWEAAKALGLNPSLAMQLVIFPQALRVIIPPLTSEFLNLAKNSSLAIAILYSDIYAVSLTVSENASAHAVEMVLIIMTIYLLINLFISSIMNWLNYKVQIK